MLRKQQANTPTLRSRRSQSSSIAPSRNYFTKWLPLPCSYSEFVTKRCRHPPESKTGIEAADVAKLPRRVLAYFDRQSR
jgi:hypothetical protein